MASCGDGCGWAGGGGDYERMYTLYIVQGGFSCGIAEDVQALFNVDYKRKFRMYVAAQ